MSNTNESAIESAVHKLMIRGGLGYEEARSMLLSVIASLPPDAKLKLEGRESED